MVTLDRGDTGGGIQAAVFGLGHTGADNGDASIRVGRDGMVAPVVVAGLRTGEKGCV